MTLTIEPEHLALVREILRRHIPNREVRAFGSRVHGRGMRKFSDLDLVVMGDETLPLTLYARLKHDFSESDLPFRVDVAEWRELSDALRHNILQACELVQETGIARETESA